MWDGKSVDKVRMLRFYLQMEKQRFESGMLGPRQAKKAEKEIARLQAEIKKVREEKKQKKKEEGNKKEK